MIINRRRVGLRTTKYITTRPRCLRRTLSEEMRHAKRDGYTAASDYESSCMDGDRITADRIRNASLVTWIRKMGAYSASLIPRPTT